MLAHEAIFSLDRVARCALKASDTLPSLSEDNAHAARLSEAPGEAHYEVRDEKGDETSGVARGAWHRAARRGTWHQAARRGTLRAAVRVASSSSSTACCWSSWSSSCRRAADCRACARYR